MEIGELPAGWETAELSEICLINPTIDKSAFADDLLVSFVPMPAVEAEIGAVDVSATRKFGEVKKGYTPFREGDVLFAKITPCMENGKMAVVPALHNDLGFGSTEFHVLRAHPGISPQFVYYFVSSRAFRHVAEHNMSGAVGQRRVTTPYLSACKVPVPPAAEQHRIVAKIEELFSELDQGVASLKTAREQLKVYRQSLLKHAFEGKLTAAWRAAHRDQLETAAALQQRIARERQARYEQQLADWQAAGKQGPKPKPPKPLPPLTTEELAELPELPAGWGWMKLGALIDEPAYGTSKKCDYETAGVGVLRIPNVVSGKVDATDLKFAQFSLEEIAAYQLAAGDLLMIRSNGSVSIVGKCALVYKMDTAYLYAGYLIRLRPLQSLALPAYLTRLLSSHELRKQIEHKAKSTSGVNNINSGEIQSLVVPVCGLTEQELILEELESKLSEADQLDQTLATALQQADALRQSILKKAFCGQLVPQDENDEPAAALLERIRANREAAPAKGRRAKRVSTPLPVC